MKDLEDSKNELNKLLTGMTKKQKQKLAIII